MEALHQFAAIPTGSFIAMNTAPLIFFLEDHPAWAEVLAGPLQQQRNALAERYKAELSNPTHWSLVPLNQAVTNRAARLRVRYGIKLPDAVQLSTALSNNATALIIHDRDFSRCKDIPIFSANH